jgi:hypothetical protein
MKVCKIEASKVGHINLWAEIEDSPTIKESKDGRFWFYLGANLSECYKRLKRKFPIHHPMPFYRSKRRDES